MRPALVPRHLLDPRPAEAAVARPIVDAVNIPLAELPQRTHELPPRDSEVPVVGPAPLARRAVEWLRSHGRRAAVRRDFTHGDEAAIDVGRLWRPTDFLAEVVPRLTPGAVLDLACGVGRDAVYLASLGWRVTAVDVLPDALERARALATHCAAAIGPIAWCRLDLERDPPAFDETFDLIVGFRYLHRPLFARFASWLRPGGSVVYETFTTAHRARHGRPASDAHVLHPGELPQLLAGLDVRYHEEVWRGGGHTARAWAVKMTVGVT